MKTAELFEFEEEELSEWRLDFGIKLVRDGDWDLANDLGDQLERGFGGEELGAGTSFGVRDISLLFPTEQQAKQAKLALRRLSRGKPRFEIEYAEVAPYELRFVEEY